MTIYAFVTESEPVPTEIYNVTFTDSDLGDNISEQKKSHFRMKTFSLFSEKMFFIWDTSLFRCYLIKKKVFSFLENTFFLRAALSDLPQKNTFNVKYKDTYPAPLVQQKHHN